MDTNVSTAVSPRVCGLAPALFISSTAAIMPATIDASTIGAYNEIVGSCITKCMAVPSIKKRLL
jgi:hypothetical protein